MGVIIQSMRQMRLFVFRQKSEIGEILDWVSGERNMGVTGLLL